MDTETKSFLRDCHISADMIKLLGVYDYNCIKDVAALNEDSFHDIEKKVRQKNFNGRVDPGSRTDLIRFFANGAINFNRFSILPKDRKKLLAAAIAALGLLTVRETLNQFEAEFDGEKEYKPVSSGSSSESDDSYESDVGSKNDEGKPPKKKAKLDLESSELKMELEEKFKLKGAIMMNKLFAETKCTEIASHQHVQGDFDIGTGKFIAKCKCLLCPKWITCTTSVTGSWNISGLKRHLTNVHLKADSMQKAKKDEKQKIENILPDGSSSGTSSQKLVAVESFHIKDERVDLVKCKPTDKVKAALTSSTSFNEKKRRLPPSPSSSPLMNLSIKHAKRQTSITKFFNKVPRDKSGIQKLPETTLDKEP